MKPAAVEARDGRPTASYNRRMTKTLSPAAGLVLTAALVAGDDEENTQY
jgi:hypothetical protein